MWYICIKSWSLRVDGEIIILSLGLHQSKRHMYQERKLDCTLQLVNRSYHGASRQKNSSEFKPASTFPDVTLFSVKPMLLPLISLYTSVSPTRTSVFARENSTRLLVRTGSLYNSADNEATLFLCLFTCLWARRGSDVVRRRNATQTHICCIPVVCKYRRYSLNTGANIIFLT